MSKPATQPTKLKIGLVFDDSLDKPDGVQQYVLILGKWLTAQGHEVHYLVGQTKRTDLPHLHSLSRNVNVRFNQNRMAIPLPANKRAIRELLEREQFDVLHVQVPYSPAMAARVIMAAGPRTAVVGMFHVAAHSKLVMWGNMALGRWLRKSLQRFDTMLFNSTASEHFAKQTFKIDGQLVPLPLELDAFYDAKPFPKYSKGLNVLFLGRFVERKGCMYLLKAVARLHDDDAWPADARVIICGKGPLEQDLKTFAADHRIDQLVEFVGYISEEDKPRYLASADIAVYPSTGGESFGMVLLEAMAASRGPVLAGNNPGYASVMAPHPESLFDPYDAQAMAAKISHLLLHAKDRQAFHEWQRTYVKQFDINTIGKQTVAIYEQALHTRRG